ASAINSFRFFAGTAGFAVIATGAVATIVIALKPAAGAYGSFGYSAAFTACLLPSDTSVYPSGGALAVISDAIELPAPGRLSTMSCCPSVSLIRGPRTRAATSAPPPTGKPTSILMGFVG